MKKYLDCWMYGVGVGMFWYMFSLWFWEIPSQSWQQVLVTVIGSGLMGLSALIYDDNHNSRPTLIKTLVHFMVIFALALGMMGFNGWIDVSNLTMLLSFFLEFVVIYLVIWGIIYTIEKQKVQRINNHLRQGR
ncbi:MULTISPECIES: DUF3021 domain-containing protein [unclassified Streptococcus]|uniref:DUF3021 domain-containing protein n=1 Tax=unclassified Streptococcus TaxID=2608887 RepID=UPI00359D8180